MMRNRTRCWVEDFPKLTAKNVGLMVKSYDSDKGGTLTVPVTYSRGAKEWLKVRLTLTEEGARESWLEWEAFKADAGRTPIGSGRIHYVRKPCRFGGTRIYFLCSDTGNTCLTLYLRCGVWVSRQAADLHYRTESEGEEDRLITARARLRNKMRNGKGGDWYVRPKGMRHDKFAAMMRRHEEIEDRLEDARNAKLWAFARRRHWV